VADWTGRLAHPKYRRSKGVVMDEIRVVEIQHRGMTESQKAYVVLVQRGSLVDTDIKYSRRYKQRTQKIWGVERPISGASLKRLEDVFDGFDGGRRPENVEVEFHLGFYRMDVSFSVDGRLVKGP
jgi:hypothetical protein